jgi:hypothetical protein
VRCGYNHTRVCSSVHGHASPPRGDGRVNAQSHQTQSYCLHAGHADASLGTTAERGGAFDPKVHSQ